MTSNLGASCIEPAQTEEEMQMMNEGIMQAVRSHFRPEFLNRLDDILIFRQLTPEVMAPIVDIQLNRLKKLLIERNIELDIHQDARKLLAFDGFNPLYGARPLKRVIQNRIQDPLAERIIGGSILEGDTVTITAADGEFIIRTAAEAIEATDAAEAIEATGASAPVDTAAGKDEEPACPPQGDD